MIAQVPLRPTARMCCSANARKAACSEGEGKGATTRIGGFQETVKRWHIGRVPPAPMSEELNDSDSTAGKPPPPRPSTKGGLGWVFYNIYTWGGRRKRSAVAAEEEPSVDNELSPELST